MMMRGDEQRDGARRRAAAAKSLGAAAVGVALLTGAWAAPAAAHPDGSYPRTFNHDFRNTINAALESRYDVLVHSARVSNVQLDSLRMLNPSIRRLVFVANYVWYFAGPSGYPATWGPFEASDPVYGWERKLWDTLEQNGWWCYARDSSGVRYKASYYVDSWAANLSSKCPRNAQGKRLCDVFADFIIDNLIAYRHTDGIFFDNLWDDPLWLNWAMWGACDAGATAAACIASPATPETKFYTGFDLDNNGVVDHPDSIKAWWGEGIRTVMARFRQRMGRDFLLVGGEHHFLDMNGMFMEAFPTITGTVDPGTNPARYKWQSYMFSKVGGYLTVYQSLLSDPRINLIDTTGPALNTYEPSRTLDRERHKRFTLGSTLLGDGYHGSRGPGTSYVFWEPEWDLRLGWPTSPAESLITETGVKIWGRRFDNGFVWVNPTPYTVVATDQHPAVGPWDAVIRQTTVAVGPPATGARVRMEAPYPNPAAGQAAVRFTAPARTPATLQVFDVRGRMVRSVWTGLGTGEPQTAVWDGDSDLGYPTPAGIYFLSLFTPGEKTEQRLVKLR
jgi:hypothetical protein